MNKVLGVRADKEPDVGDIYENKEGEPYILAYIDHRYTFVSLKTGVALYGRIGSSSMIGFASASDAVKITKGILTRLPVGRIIGLQVG